ncbi:MAG: DUF5050 domain-containing protein [bacterium]
MDLGYPKGTPVYAVERGMAYYDDGTFNIVRIKHPFRYRDYDSLPSRYLHNDTVVIDSSQWVNRGDIIAYVGDRGSPGSFHLHFEFGEYEKPRYQPLSLLPYDNAYDPGPIEFINIENGETVFGICTVKVRIYTTIDKDLNKAELLVNGQSVDSICYDPRINCDNPPRNSVEPIALGVDIFKFKWNTLNFSNGTHTLKVRAYDVRERVGEASITVRVSNRRDVGVTQILHPQNGRRYSIGNCITPQATVENFGTRPETVSVHFEIYRNGNPLYQSVKDRVAVNPGQSKPLEFGSWTPSSIGACTAKCYTNLSYDEVRSNDTACSIFFVDSGGSPPPGTRSDNSFDPRRGSGPICDHDGCCWCSPGSCTGCCICTPGNCNGCCICQSGDNPPLPPVGWRRYFSIGSFPTCWHWKTGTPWTANPTHYMLLDWDFTSGTVIESLISPVVSLANCTTATLCCSTYFDHKRNGYTAKLVGSIDGGATYPYLIKDYAGSDFGPGAESFNITSWAAGQSRVRFAWVYIGGVNKIDFWALDNVRVVGFPGYEHDVAVTEVITPRGQIPLNTRLKPKVLISNFGNNIETVKVVCKIDETYTDSVSFTLQQGSSYFIYFDEWLATLGNHTIRAYATLVNDNNRANDTVVSTFQVVANTWLIKERTLQKIRRGGALVTAGENKIYALTGYPNMSFMRYHPVLNQWRRMASPPGDAGEGAALAWAGDSFVYMLKGGASKGFYRYNIKRNRWVNLANTPGKIGRGGALAWTGGDYIYALRGGETKSFYRYRISTNSWDCMAETPAKVGWGGALAWDRGNYIYALRGSNEQSFYRYQIDNNSWTTRASTPASVGKGGSLAYDTVNNMIFAFRGKEANQFWAYNPGSNSWLFRNSAPQPVGGGGALTYYNGSIFGMRGSNERDFWNYALPVGGDFEGNPPDSSKKEGPGITLAGDEIGIVLDFSDNAHPVISPDGNWVSYQKLDTMGCYQLYKIRTEGGEEIRLTNDSFSYTNPKWSPDGEFIVSLRDGEIYAMRNDGTEGAVLATGICANPQWSADGEFIIFTKWDGNHRLYIVDANGSFEEQLSTDNCDIRFPQWSPDGEWIVYQKLVNGTYQICKMSIASGEEGQLTNDVNDNTNPCVSPDGSWIAYEKVDENGYRQIYKISSSGGEETALTNEACDHESPKISLDGNWITYVKWVQGDESHICKYETQSATETVLTQGKAVRENPDINSLAGIIVYEMNGEQNDRSSDNRSIFMVRVGKTGINDGSYSSHLPKRLNLYQNCPNPTKGIMTICYEIPIESRVSLKIYDGSGRLIKTLVDNMVKPGNYTANWNRKDNEGKKVPAGIYFYELVSNNKCLLRKAVLLK